MEVQGGQIFQDAVWPETFSYELQGSLTITASLQLDPGAGLSLKKDRFIFIGDGSEPGPSP